VESIPSRAFTSSRLSVAHAPEPTSSRFFAPTTTSPGLAPCAAVRPPPPRFRSQVFTTSQRFTSTPGLRGLVSCRSRPGVPPAEPSPRRGRAPIPGPLASLQFSAAVPEARCDELLPPGFTDSHALAWSHGSPPELGRRFRPDASDLPRHLEPTAPGPPRSGDSVCFEALIPPRARSHERRLPDAREPLLSWTFAPPEPCSGRASDPR